MIPAHTRSRRGKSSETESRWVACRGGRHDQGAWLLAEVVRMCSGSCGDTEARRGCVVCRLYLSKAVTFFKNNHETRVPRDGWVKETGPCDRWATAHLSRAPAPAAPAIRAAPPWGCGHLCPTCRDHTAAYLRKAQGKPNSGHATPQHGCLPWWPVHRMTQPARRAPPGRTGCQVLRGARWVATPTPPPDPKPLSRPAAAQQRGPSEPAYF